MEQKVGILVAAGVFAVIGIFLVRNMQPRPAAPSSSSQTPERPEEPLAGNVLAAVETFIDETEQNGMLITAVWLPPIQMAETELPQDPHVIHLEADIHALEGNANGFAKGAWIPYLTVRYEIEPIEPPGEPIRGTFLPMVAKDGPHYGATISMPGPGKYRLVYQLDPPSFNNFGRHNDPVTGVAPWWEPFQIEFPFDYAGPKEARAD